MLITLTNCFFSASKAYGRLRIFRRSDGVAQLLKTDIELSNEIIYDVCKHKNNELRQRRLGQC
jgi:hypothetical protein